MKSITSSEGESFAMIIGDPSPPKHGKGAWPCFETGCIFLPSLRRIGARSVFFQNMHVFDSALQSAQKRMFQQRFELLHDDQAQGDEPKESNLDCLLEWFLSIGCCAHDIQKSLRWSIVRVDLGPRPH